MTLFLILILIGVVMLVLRQVMLKSSAKQQPANARNTRRRQRQEKTMQNSIGLSAQSMTPEAKPKADEVRREPVLVTTGSMHEARKTEQVVTSTPQHSAEAAPKHTPSTAPENMLTLFVVPPRGTSLPGYELLQTILANGLRYGSDHIFHCHVESNGTGDELFHLAAATKEGTFDLQNMGAYQCPGILCYFYLDQATRPAQAFERMLEVAQALAEDLDADLLDPIRRPLTNDTIALMRQHVEKQAQPI